MQLLSVLKLQIDFKHIVCLCGNEFRVYFHSSFKLSITFMTGNNYSLLKVPHFLTSSKHCLLRIILVLQFIIFACFWVIDGNQDTQIKPPAQTWLGHHTEKSRIAPIRDRIGTFLLYGMF